ncbi:hypothetical protein RO3G_00342 [Rhizopus delemar RA 99-880]|uniref:IBR domain-containing protein n=1 Tax=Rhizopus delemar (strain RA 99-880 / ATCC MYA-4621 / FGSC 9543 / NRRL 43880) TaxID=246409 RepID=I1BHF8_RHIO9|nr:hypothetical protein RO3G_00342 [Rhizopus delemar RA 99-880]|eukprot:EIE75638.1 hypothetical protein RO3G_00342 [Rhizopus delemar RA 99-880]
MLDKDEYIEKTLKVAKRNAWTRCPRCQCIIEKTQGCISMHCICGTSFCYRCGGIQTNHGCYNRCEGLSNEKLVTLRKSMFILSDEN